MKEKKRRRKSREGGPKERWKSLSLWLGIILLLVWVIDLVDKSTNIYGPPSQALWFCSVMVLVLGIGFLLRSGMVLVAALAMMLVVQPPWLLDFFLQPGGKSFDGMASYVYGPGFQPWQFLITLRHVFMIPLGVLGVALLGRKSRMAYVIVIAFIAALLLSSYAVPPSEENMNCIHEPCIPGVDFGLEGGAYSLAFYVVMTSLGLLFTAGVNAWMGYRERKSISGRERKAGWALVGLVFLLAIAGTVYAAAAYLGTPHYWCAQEEECPGCEVELDCLGARGSVEDPQMLYRMSNPSNKGYVCDVMLSGIGEKSMLVADDSYLAPGMEAVAGAALPAAEDEGQIVLSPSCREYLPTG